MSWTNAYSVEQIGSFLKQARREKGYTQDELAELIGVSHATLSALENGKNVSSHVLMRALNTLGLRLIVLPKNASARVEEAL